MKKISFVIPCYRSENTVGHVVSDIEKTLQRKELAEAYTYEIILVNDCSPDNTLGVIRELCKEKEYVKGIAFARNFGQHAALMAGLRASTGDL